MNQMPMLTPEAHDPGGKVLFRMLPGMTGNALFSDDGKHRLWLSRQWGGGVGRQRGSYAAFIGMNPSVASAEFDDPTCRREIEFARIWGYDGYRKLNVLTWRATHPKDLLAPGVEPCHPANLEHIIRICRGAAKIVVCHGNLHPKLQRYGDAVVEALAARGLEMFCFGLNGDGKSPVHPLYLKKTTPLIPYRPIKFFLGGRNPGPT